MENNKEKLESGFRNWQENKVNKSLAKFPERRENFTFDTGEEVKRLYEKKTNPVEIIKWTTIYSCLENTTDACERVADSIEDVIMKNS